MDDLEKYKIKELEMAEIKNGYHMLEPTMSIDMGPNCQEKKYNGI